LKNFLKFSLHSKNEDGSDKPQSKIQTAANEKLHF